MSDPVDLDVAPLANLAVSLYFAGKVSATTEHSLAQQTTYLSPAGNCASATALPSGGSTTTTWYFLNGVEVGSRSPRDAIVALGDSITDGYASTVDANRRWPNYLAARLQEKHRTSDIAVVDQGISGNRVLHDFIGPNALARFDRDVLAQSGARWVIVLEGINDIGIPGAFGLAGDAVIDFDRATRDPAHPSRLLPAYDSGDHLHPNDMGYEAMARAIDPSLFSRGHRGLYLLGCTAPLHPDTSVPGGAVRAHHSAMRGRKRSV